MEAVDNAKTKKNDVIFSMPKNVSKCDFYATETRISEGQDMSSPKALFKDGALTISVEAGRKNTKEVADYFKENVKDGFVVGTKTSTPMPEKLHFAFKGKLTIIFNDGTENEYGMIIGQGHTHDDRNNWWVGLDFGIKEKDVNKFDLSVSPIK